MRIKPSLFCQHRSLALSESIMIRNISGRGGSSMPNYLVQLFGQNQASSECRLVGSKMEIPTLNFIACISSKWASLFYLIENQWIARESADEKKDDYKLLPLTQSSERRLFCV